MPKDTKVDTLYEELKAKGYSTGSAAAIAQSQTHQSLKTGKPLPPSSKTYQTNPVHPTKK